MYVVYEVPAVPTQTGRTKYAAHPTTGTDTDTDDNIEVVTVETTHKGCIENPHRNGYLVYFIPFCDLWVDFLSLSSTLCLVHYEY